MPEDKDARRRELYTLMGDLPDRRRSVRWEKVSEEQREKYVLEKLKLDLNGIEDVPGSFVRPPGTKPGRRLPTILYNHAHGGNYKLGKDELIDRSQYFQTPTYAEELTARGYNALCIDHWVFGGRSGRTESSVFKQMLWQGRVMWGMMVFDSLRAIVYLVTRDDVDAQRIGTLGLSMGSTMAWWTAALDERV
jgi:dienelactone hydrolase